ncbi:MAG: exopolysaccharide biosynthesis polyprenyl glycosylphosphotransferase [Paludibacteraceae bacterium]|nr:exopolysaccharide biosynthesis polyprenyl glycosylphosphotransferase [Paludibacteraceae bacterium]
MKEKYMIRHRLMQLLYVAVDMLSAAVVWLLFLYFRWLALDGRIAGWGDFMGPAFDFSVNDSHHPLLVFPLGCAVLYYLSGYYMRPGKQRWTSLIANTLTVSALVTLVTFFVVVMDDVSGPEDVMRYYKSLLVLFVLQSGVLLTFRLVLHGCFRGRMQRERVLIRTEEYGSDYEIYRRIAELFPTGKEIALTSRVYDILTGAAQIRHIQEPPVVVVSEPKMSDSELVMKRLFDVTASLLALVLLSPLLLLLALGVRLSSPGPVIYRQERVGLHGRPFRILKFRTMVEDAESGVPQLSQESDPRVTPFGRWMRKYRLDELPQFINILRGEMSIVGPRPERQYFIDKITERAPYYCLLYKVRPGLTSWGPVKVGYTDTMDKMIQRLNYDIAYTENMSLWLDVKILFSTVGVIIDGKGQ